MPGGPKQQPTFIALIEVDDDRRQVSRSYHGEHGPLVYVWAGRDGAITVEGEIHDGHPRLTISRKHGGFTDVVATYDVPGDRIDADHFTTVSSLMLGGGASAVYRRSYDGKHHEVELYSDGGWEVVETFKTDDETAAEAKFKEYVGLSVKS